MSGSTPTSRERPSDELLVPLLRRRAEDKPDAPAIVAGRQGVSYGQLWRDSDRLAGALVSALGGDGEAVVPLVLDRSPELFVAVLAVWKAGFAYGVVDPVEPAPRRELLLAGMGAPVVVTRSDLVSSVPELTPVLVDKVEDGVTRPFLDPDPEALAYVLYTSGSTGAPKGVMVTHRALANVCAWHRRHLRVESADRASQLYPPSFDASTTEVWPYLSAGACVHLVPSHVRTDPAALLEWVRRHGITRLDVPTPVVELLLEEPGIARVPLRTLLTGGEILRRRPPRGVPFEMLNLYGPTEATVSACHAVVEPGDPGDRPVPVGHPIDNTVVRILDQRGRPVPAGGTGELHLGGTGLARGYRHRPDLTAASFVPDPCAVTPGARLYRTGDLARQEPDGTVVVLGRRDQQVKIRGFRVEPGEVEAALHHHPAVREAAVVAADTGGSRHLVAHLSCRSGLSVTEPELCEHLAGRLPSYMIPVRFVIHDALPLTPHGKVDRQRLADPPPVGSGQPAGDSAMTVAEHVAAATARVLSGEAVRLDQPFAELGGHSLLAAQVVAELRRRCGVEVPVPLLLGSRSLAAFASEVERLKAGPGVERAPALVPRAGARAPAPLTFQQEDVWFLDQLVGGNRAYHAQATVHFLGDLKIDLLERAINAVIARHEVLRTTFVETADGPRQFIAPSYRFHLPVVDLSRLAPQKRDSALDQLLREELDAGFDVGRLPLARWKLIRLASDEHVLIQVDHHFVHDGWSETVLWREIEACYVAWACGEEPRLAPLEVQYADYAEWQRARFSGAYRDESLRFWAERLRDLPPPLDLPTVRPRPLQQSFRGGLRRIELDGDLYRQLRQFSRAGTRSLFVTMYAAFAVLLSRYTGATDVVVASAFANRQPPATAQLVGMLVNMIVLRLQLPPHASFGEVVKSAQQVVWGAMEHQDTPFPEVVRAVRPARDPSRNPIAQIAFNFHDSPMPELSWPGVSGRFVERGNQTAKFDLNVIVVPQAEQRAGIRPAADSDRLTMLWEYNTDLLDQVTVDQLARHYVTLLKAVVQNPDQPVDRLPLLSPEERLDVVRRGRRAATFPAEGDVASLFEAAAAAAPQQAAVTWLRDTPTGPDVAVLRYAELDARANRVAHALRRRAVAPEEPVGLLLPRGPELVIAQLAVLKAGAAYLPLDRSFPPQRLTAILAGAGTRLVVAGDQPAAPDGGGRRALLPDTDVVLTSVEQLASEVPDEAAAGPPDRTAGPGTLACIMFTSGSTGRPKGVLVEQRGIVQLVCDAGIADYDRGRRVGHAANPAFDAALFEIWGALLHAGTVCVVGAGELLSPWELPEALRRLKVEVLFLTTSLFHEMATAQAHDLQGLEQLMFGGEAADPTVVRALLARTRREGHGPELTNVYGPTEATSLATAHQVTELPEWAVRVPIGRPIGNISCYVLDRQFEPVPTGVVGDLYLAGPGLARGYLHDPALTAEAYRPDPVVPGGGRMYRTGDRARWLPSGALEFVARTDEQVKIRGFRVEPAEIRAALLSQTGVAACAVRLWREDEIGRKALVAYLVPDRPAGLDTEAVRAAVARRLPGYMVPTDLVLQDSLPLNSRGKVDHSRLAPPPRPGQREARAGATPHERLLCRVWAEVLDVDEVDPDDDFYALGGHSLLALRLSSKLRHEHGITLRVSQILDTPSVRELAKLVPAPGPGS